MANESEAKLKTLALIIKFGHDLFDGKDVESIAAAAVSNSHALLKFRSSALFRLEKNRKCNVLGQFAQTQVNEFSAAVQQQKNLIGKADFDKDGIVLLSNDKLPEELAANSSVYLLCKLPLPAASRQDHSYIWLLEYEKNIPESAVNTVRLLGRSVAEALSLAESSSSGKCWHLSGFPQRIAKYCFWLLLFIGIMFIPVRNSSTAEFMLKAPDITASYAWFDSPVAKCLKQDGEFVRKGEVIVQFDTAERKYRLVQAEAELKEAAAELDLAAQTAFTDESKLGNVKLLKARCNVLQVAVNEAKWYLAHSEIRAEADGLLALADGRAEQLTGKAVKAGDKLFEIYGGDGMIAEIMVNERDSSILHDKIKAELFLHTAPEKGISGETFFVAQYPVLNEQNLYCYKVLVKLPETERKGLRFGMRGVAKLSGAEVHLGYYLFKNLILYFRNW
ncbi:MAG: HlyD family secretion protein [Lentisphaeria bacterium]|nr:HlyD family secretion protein [Lentisphaeria bacterium]